MNSSLKVLFSAANLLMARASARRDDGVPPEEARVDPKKNEVPQGIRMPLGVRPDVTRADLAPGDRILLCSDGLWEALSHDEMQSILESDGTMRQLAVQLVDRANNAGGYDNITVVLYEAHNAGEAKNDLAGDTGQADRREKTD